MTGMTPMLATNLNCDTREIQWVVSEVTAILSRLDADSPTALILRQTRNELCSLIPATEVAPKRPDLHLAAA